MLYSIYLGLKTANAVYVATWSCVLALTSHWHQQLHWWRSDQHLLRAKAGCSAECSHLCEPSWTCLPQLAQQPQKWESIRKYDYRVIDKYNGFVIYWTRCRARDKMAKLKQWRLTKLVKGRKYAVDILFWDTLSVGLNFLLMGAGVNVCPLTQPMAALGLLALLQHTSGHFIKTGSSFSNSYTHAVQSAQISSRSPVFYWMYELNMNVITSLCVFFSQLVDNSCSFQQLIFQSS